MKKKGFSLLSGFEMDLRSLGLFRLAFGVCLFIDVAFRMLHAEAFYSDYGVMPREALISQFLSIWEWSFFLFNGQTPMVIALMGVLLVAITAFTLGYYTRIAAVVTWLLLISLHSRNQVILHGGDDVMRAISFWCMFAPLGAEFSLDKYLNPQFKPGTKSVLSFGAAGLLLQLLYIYIFTALLKWDKIWWIEGSAVYYTLNLDQFTSSVGKILREFPALMRGMTYSTVILELVGPFSVIAPVYFLRRRIFVASAFIIFHFGLSVNMVLGMFPWTCMACWLMVLPPGFWDKFPEGYVERKMSWLKGLAERIKNISTVNSWRGHVPRLRFGRLSEAMAGVFLVLICIWNITQLDVLNLERSDGFRRTMHISETYQRWSMFAPYPRKDDGWYVIESKLFNGDKWNTFRDVPVSYEKPEDVAGTYKNSIWRKYMTNLWLRTYSKYRVYFGRYICRSWNEKQTDESKRIETVHIYYMMEMTPPPGQPVPEPKREQIWRHYCYDKPADWVD